MTTTTTPAPAGQAPGKDIVKESPRQTLRMLFEKQRPELSKLLPRGMDIDRLYRMALTECVKNPKLLECTQESWALAMQVCASQGLYPDSGLGYMYLIPRNNSKKLPNGNWVKRMEVSAQRGYQGDIALARKTGEIADIYAEVVYQKDHYRVVKGLDRNIEHIPSEDEDPGPLRACYAVAKLRSGETAWVTLTRRDVERHKASAQGTDDKDSPWKKHEAEMWKKTAIRALAKWLPKSTEAAETAVRQLATDEGRVIETTGVDLGRVELPSGPPSGGALDRVTEQLAAGAQDQGSVSDTEGCPHPGVPTTIPAGETIVCGKCGEEFTSEAAPVAGDREPGSDDGDPTPTEAVRAIAGAAQAQPARRQAGLTPAGGRQGRLSE